MKASKTVDKQREKYNKRMKERSAQKKTSGKSPKAHTKEPQVRNPSAKVNKNEGFEKSKPWTKKIAIALGRRPFQRKVRK